MSPDTSDKAWLVTGRHESKSSRVLSNTRSARFLVAMEATSISVFGLSWHYPGSVAVKRLMTAGRLRHLQRPHSFEPARPVRFCWQSILVSWHLHRRPIHAAGQNTSSAGGERIEKADPKAPVRNRPGRHEPAVARVRGDVPDPLSPRLSRCWFQLGRTTRLTASPERELCECKPCSGPVRAEAA